MPVLFFLLVPLVLVPFFFHPGFIWVAIIVLCVLSRGPGRRRHWHDGCRPARAPMAAPAPRPANPPAAGGPTWPDLYPDEAGRPARPAPEGRGKVEYF
ncbi:MAG TPA: hypothetical protein VFL91_00475 [Thermomicrobiales bacterium]|nr:hypothetical protein [Thermomicrobiales bacterium]